MLLPRLHRALDEVLHCKTASTSSIISAGSTVCTTHPQYWASFTKTVLLFVKGKSLQDRFGTTLVYSCCINSKECFSMCSSCRFCVIPLHWRWEGIALHSDLIRTRAMDLQSDHPWKNRRTHSLFNIGFFVRKWIHNSKRLKHFSIKYITVYSGFLYIIPIA